MHAKSSFIHLITICVFSTLSVTALAQEDQAPSADEIARQLADPNAVIGSLNFNLDHITYNE